MIGNQDALLTFSIGPVHTFIAQARRVADLWAGSTLLSHFIKKAVETVRDQKGRMVFPFVENGEPVPDGLPNLFVCLVPAAEAVHTAQAVEAAVRDEWDRLVMAAVDILKEHGLNPDGAVRDQTRHALEVAWSWMPIGGGKDGYEAASKAGAKQFAASRMFRPFSQIGETGEKCAVCGERTALPNGRRDEVGKAWKSAENQSKGNPFEPFFRGDQTRLCLVCGTKRLFPKIVATEGAAATVRFSAFEAFEPKLLESDEKKRYFAIVSMDGDHMGKILGWGKDEVSGGGVEAFHRKVSEILTSFANSLRTTGTSELNVRNLKSYKPRGHSPQLIYAGGEDVLFVCDARDALPLAKLVRQKYRADFAGIKGLLEKEDAYDRFTISAGILIAHTKHPAGLLFRDAERLLKEKAKTEAGRDAVAIRLVKRGGVPVEVAFKWEGVAGERPQTWADAFDALVEAVSARALASRQTFNLREEEETLSAAFGHETALWQGWLAEKLSRGEGSAAQAEELAGLITSFFVHGKTDALRVARFLAAELPATEGPES